MIRQKYMQPVGGLTLQKKLQATISTVFYNGRVVPEHTKYEHFYRDTKDGSLYPSVTGALQVLNKPHLKQWAVNRGIEHIINWASKVPEITKVGLYEQLEVAKKTHTIKLETASRWGGDGHNIIDSYISEWIKIGQKPDYPILKLATDDISNEGKCAALGAEKFFNDYTLFPIVSEKKIISKKHRIGGTLDNLFIIGDCYKSREGKTNCVHSWLEKRLDIIHCAQCGREEKLQIALIDIKTSNILAQNEYPLQVSAYAKILQEMCGIKTSINWILHLDKNKPKYTIGVIPNISESFKAFLDCVSLSKHIKLTSEPVVLLHKKNIIKL